MNKGDITNQTTRTSKHDKKQIFARKMLNLKQTQRTVTGKMKFDLNTFTVPL